MRNLTIIAFFALTACESLWGPYIASFRCNPEVNQCTDAGDFADLAAADASSPQSCPLGFVLTNMRCSELRPSNGIDPSWLTDGKVAFSPSQDLVIDTDLGTITDATGSNPLPAVVYRQTTPVDCGGGWMVGIGVFSFTTISIPEGVRVRVKGTRALALLASGAIAIEGLLDLRGSAAECSDPSCAGPGGFAGSTFLMMPLQPGLGPGGGGYGYSVGGPGDEAGGGGGAACGNGGHGGDAGVTMYPGGAGGVAYVASSLIPLCGGSGGGTGGPASYASDPGGRGGGGGGAVQLVSATAVRVSSSSGTPSGIQAGGGGGQADHAQTYDDGGGGGGAGGSILIEAPTIAITSGAVLAANGGGGGGGYNSGAIATEGSPALLSSNPAPGGPGVRRGGMGSAGSNIGGENAPGPIGDGGAGGGGGGGRIRLNTIDGTVTLTGELSPGMGACTSTGTVLFL